MPNNKNKVKKLEQCLHENWASGSLLIGFSLMAILFPYYIKYILRADYRLGHTATGIYLFSLIFKTKRNY
jgi:hypothetical protein